MIKLKILPLRKYVNQLKRLLISYRKEELMNIKIPVRLMPNRDFKKIFLEN